MRTTMTLALFDLDNTLLSGDSDYGWGCFLVEKNIVDKAQYEAANLNFFEQYQQGKLDIYEYSAFSFAPLANMSMDKLNALHREFMEQFIAPMMGEKARQLVQHHKDLGHTLLVITATNSFITGPIARAFGIDNLLATDPKIVNNRYTTEIDGIPCYKEGKVTRLNQWLSEHDITLQGSYFYSDSSNDLPLMRLVDHPVAVDPDDELASFAEQSGWEIISLRN